VVDGLVRGITLSAYLPDIFTGITLVAASYLATVLLYAGFLAYCTAVKIRDEGRLAEMPAVARGHVYAIVYLAAILDIAFNVTVGTLIFLQPPHPKRLLFTARLKSWKDDTGYRGRFARWFCDGWLNPGDKGHC
jgi:hypothetical protein